MLFEKLRQQTIRPGRRRLNFIKLISSSTFDCFSANTYLFPYSREVQKAKTERNPPQLAKNPPAPRVRAARIGTQQPLKRQEQPLRSVEQMTRRAANRTRRRAVLLPGREAMRQISPTSNRRMERRKRRRRPQRGVVRWGSPTRANRPQANKRLKRQDREKTLSL